MTQPNKLLHKVVEVKMPCFKGFWRKLKFRLSAIATGVDLIFRQKCPLMYEAE